jgi:hypothetical protein
MSADDEKLGELLLRWEEAWEHGDDLSPDTLCADCPERVELLRKRIVALKEMAWMKDSDQGDSSTSEPDQPLPGTLGNRYRIEGLIGQGGFGRVYRAFDEELQRTVAIKISRTPNPNGLNQPDTLLREARRVAQLRHPGIVSVHDIGREDGHCFIVADFIGGQSLAAEIAKERPSPSSARDLIAEVAEHLHYAHEQGFVHRDIKPANILLDKEGKPLLTDFGIAATTTELSEGQEVSSGTLPYMAPEQVAGEVQLIDGRTDIYALGVVLYELLTGSHPFQARTPTALREQILFRQPKPPSTSNPAIPKELERICLRCLAKHPADRYSSAHDLAEALRQSSMHHSTFGKKMFWTAIALVTLVGLVGAWSLIPGLMRHGATSQTAPIDAEVRKIQGAFFFDGKTRIITPVERAMPITLEAWVRPGEYTERNCQFVIGSDIPTEYGIGLSICEAILAAEYMEGSIYSKQVLPLNEWSHVAVVFGEADTRLYFNGKLVKAGPATKRAGGTTFVIGNVGRDNPINFFRGNIRSVRITKGERYTGEFVPEEPLEPGEKTLSSTTLLVYCGTQIDGSRVPDLSGHGNHGIIARVGAPSDEGHR